MYTPLFSFLRYALVVVAFSCGLQACSERSANDSLASAKAYLDKGDRAAGIIELKNALQADPSLAEARLLFGQVLLDSGDARGALIELGKAKERGAADDKLAPLMARALLAQGQAEKVIATYGKTSLSASDATANLQASLASAYALQGKNTEAMAAIESSLRADPGNERAQLTRARLLRTTTGAAEALTALDEFLTRYPQNAEGWQVKGEILAFGGKIDEAVEAYRKSLAIDKSSMQAHSGLLALLIAKKDVDGANKQVAALRAVHPNHPQTLLFTGILALDRNDIKTARENAEALLKVLPEDARVLHLAGAVEFRRNALLRAESHLSKAIKLVPGHVKARMLLAQTHMRGGDPAKALAVLQPLLEEQSKELDAFGLAAEAYLQQGDPKHAEELFTRASKLDPKDLRSRTALAALQVKKGQTKEGIAQLRALAASDPGVSADLALISVLTQRKEVDQALKAVDALEKKTPGKPTAANLRGRIELSRGDKVKARQAFEAALGTDPAFFPAIRALAALDMDAKQFDTAAARFSKVLETEPKNLQANMALVAVRESSGAGDEQVIELLTKVVKQSPTEAAPRLALVRKHMERNDNKRALAAAQEGVAALPENAELWTLLAQAQATAGDFNQAVAALNKVIALEPQAPEPHVRLAELHRSKNDRVAATQELRKALAIKPDYLPAQATLVALEVSANRHAEARSVVKTIQTQRGDEPVGLMLAGDIDASQKDWASAVKNYRAAIGKSATTVIAIRLHRSLLAGGKAAEAKQFEAEWQKEHPRDVAFTYHLGDVALGQANYALAEQFYQSVLDSQPNNAAAMNNLAWLRWKAKKPGALEYAEKANKLSPDKPALMDTLAEIHADEGRLDKALEIQKRAVSLAPDFPPYRLHLAKMYIAAGQKSAAKEELTKLAAQDERSPIQPEVRKLLASL
jgi:putative PEP-CTERM system TPR-repeat lipoprotein